MNGAVGWPQPACTLGFCMMIGGSLERLNPFSNDCYSVRNTIT